MAIPGSRWRLTHHRAADPLPALEHDPLGSDTVADVLDELVQRFVQPYYLHMMRTNAVDLDDRLAEEVRALGREIPVSDVFELLQSHWRPRVMGAWFAAARTEVDFCEAVLESLDTCRGSLTAAPLAVAALVHVGPTTLQHIADYAERDAAKGWGAAGFAVAAIEHLTGAEAAGPVEENDRQRLTAMLHLALRLSHP